MENMHYNYGYNQPVSPGDPELEKISKKIGWMYKNRQQLKTSKVRDRQNGNGRKCVLEKLEKKMS